MQANSVSAKKSLIYIRAILTLCIILLAAYNLNDILENQVYIIFYVVVLLGTNVFSFFVPEEKFQGVKIHYVVFLMDIIFIVLGAYWLAHLDFQFMIVLFLTIFMSALSQSLKLSLVIALIVNCLYFSMKAYNLLPGESLMDDRLLLNIPFLFMVALHASYLSEKASEEEESVRRLQRAKKDLSERVKGTEIELSEYERFANRVYESFNDGVIVLDSYGLIRVFTSKCEKIFNTKKGRVLNFLYREARQLGGVADIITDLKAKKIESADRQTVIEVDGERKPVIVSTAFVMDEENVIIGILCTVRGMNPGPGIQPV